MIVRVLKLVVVGSVVRRVVKHPAVAMPSRTLYHRFERRRAAGQWHHVDAPDKPPADS